MKRIEIIHLFKISSSKVISFAEIANHLINSVSTNNNTYIHLVTSSSSVHLNVCPVSTFLLEKYEKKLEQNVGETRYRSDIEKCDKKKECNEPREVNFVNFICRIFQLMTQYYIGSDQGLFVLCSQHIIGN